MGPLVTRGQQAAAFDGIRRLAGEAAFVCGGDRSRPRSTASTRSKSAFVAPTLLQGQGRRAAPRRCTRSRCSARPRPSCPIATSRTPARWSRGAAARWCASVYGEDKDLLARMVERDRRRATGGFWWSIRRSPAPIPATASSCRNAITAVPAAPAPARSWAACTGCASITSGWRCRDRAICSRACRQRPRVCIEIASGKARHRAPRTAGANVLTSGIQRLRVSQCHHRTADHRRRVSSSATACGAMSNSRPRPTPTTDRGARARGRAPVVSRSARHPARQDRDGRRRRARDAQRLLDHHHAARQGHLAQDRVPGVHRRRRLRHGGDGGRRRLPDDRRSDDVPRAALGAARPAGCCATSISATASRCRSRRAISIGRRCASSPMPASTIMAGLEVEFHVFKLDNPRLDPGGRHLAAARRRR